MKKPLKLREGQILYRAEPPYFAPGRIVYQLWKVFRLTDQGAWIRRVWYREEKLDPAEPVVRSRGFKWISCKTRYVSPSKREADRLLKRRTESYIQHCFWRLDEALKRGRLLKLDKRCLERRYPFSSLNWE